MVITNLIGNNCMNAKNRRIAHPKIRHLTKRNSIECKSSDNIK